MVTVTEDVATVRDEKWEVRERWGMTERDGG
jgi:hypothetical protein